MVSTKECLNNLRNYKPKNDYLDISYEKRAAVLIPLIINEKEELEILFTLRSSNLSSHAGEVALPGGKVDENDESIIVTAFREAEEEVGLKSSDAEYLTYFEPFLTNQLLVTPVAALIINPLFKPIPNPSEVSECFTIPLRVFISKEHHLSFDTLWNKLPYRTHHFKWNDWTVIGFSASICVEVAKIAFNIQNVDWKERAKGQLTRKESIENLLRNFVNVKQQNKSKL